MVGKAFNRLFGRKLLFVDKNQIDNYSAENLKIINLIGAPAIGKTTMTKKMLKNGILYTKRTKIKIKPELNELYLEILKNTISKAETLNEIRDRISDIVFDQSILNKKELDGVIFVDQGLPHFFYSEILRLYKSDKKRLKEVTRGRGVILLYCNPADILERIEKRKEATGKVVRWHEGKGAEEIIDYTNKMQSTYFKIAEIFDEFKCFVKVKKV